MGVKMKHRIPSLYKNIPLSPYIITCIGILIKCRHILRRKGGNLIKVRFDWRHLSLKALFPWQFSSAKHTIPCVPLGGLAKRWARYTLLKHLLTSWLPHTGTKWTGPSFTLKPVDAGEGDLRGALPSHQRGGFVQTAYTAKIDTCACQK